MEYRKQQLLSRNNSICPTPEEVLLDLVKSNKLEKIKTFIKENDNINLLSHEYSYPHFGKILYVACCDHAILADTIETLLELGANPCDETEDQGEIIHVVVRFTRSDVLKILLKYLGNKELNSTFKGNNALLVLIKEGDYERLPELLECAKLLIEAGINVNHADFKNLTPILWAIKKNRKDLVEIIINNSKNVDIDTYKLNGKTARELILSNYSQELILPDKLINSGISVTEQLFNYLKAYKEEDFINFNGGDLSEYKDSTDGTYTLSQLSCNLGLTKAVKHLLQNKADWRKITEKTPDSPLTLSSVHGYYEIVELLLEQDHTLSVSCDTLTSLLNNMNLNPTDESYEKTFKLLLRNQDDISLNTGNSLTQTPLHLAVKFGKPEHVLQLLRKGASLANKNQFDIMPIEYIDAEILEEHLDECVEINDVDKNNIFVTLNYRTLLPFPLKRIEDLAENCEDGEKLDEVLVPETDAIKFMCHAPHLKFLLTHPVIVTLLLLKWYKVHKLFLINFLFYVIFLFGLLLYIFVSYGNFHYINRNLEVFSSIANISYVVLCITYIILVLREAFQILVSPLKYYKDLDNWIEVILIFIVGSILFTKNPTNDTRKQLSSIAILLSAFELVLMMGQHPRLTTNVVMFKRVSFNFIKFLAWYFLLIAAFALSFYILFSETNEENYSEQSENDGRDENSNDENFFINPGVALFKTLVMLTGEFDASSMNFHSFPVTSKVIFILFVLMIALILLNLLNGLAVSDTQSIKNDAECVGLMARTEYIHYIESMFLGNILPTNLMNCLQKFCCFLPFANDLHVILGKPISKYICVYPKTHVTIPMSNDVEMFEKNKKDNSKRESAVSVFNSLYLDRDIRRKIKKVLQKQKMQNGENHLRIRIKKMENEQNKVLITLKDIQDKLTKIQEKLTSE